MTSQPKEKRVVTTYGEAIKNLENGFDSLGDQRPKDYEHSLHPLEMILEDLGNTKLKYVVFGQMKNVNEELFHWAKETKIKPLRKILNDAIETLSVEELASITMDTGRSYRLSFLSYLGEIGEISLFIKAFKKINTQLNDNTLVHILAKLYQSYCGSLISEPLGLGSSLLDRGDPCYIAMAELMINELHKRDKAKNLIENLLKDKWLTIDVLPSLLNKEVTYSLDDYKTAIWSYRNQSIDLDKAKVHAEAERRYNLFVIQQNRENLFWKLLYKYAMSPQILNENSAKFTQQQSIASSFLLAIFAHKKLIAVAAFLIVSGLVGLTVGVIGFAGIAAIKGTTAIVSASLGGASLGLGSLGFFAAFTKEKDDPVMQENDFFVGYSASSTG